MTYASDSNIASSGSIVFTGTGASGYQSGAGKYATKIGCFVHNTTLAHPKLTVDPRPCSMSAVDSLRYFDVVKGADLDLVNANIQANGGKVRYNFCSHG